MQVYRICLTKWSKQLAASGFPGRWNSKGKLVIYTAGNRALACLENIVHRGGEGLNSSFNILTIDIPKDVHISKLNEDNLDPDWYKYSNYSYCRNIGDEWIENRKSLVLKVPSAIIPSEYNYLINPLHNDFKKVTIAKVEDFKFDPRV